MLVLCLLTRTSLKAQQHFNLWTRATVALPFAKKFRTDVEYQHRRQSGFGNHNAFDDNLMHSFRLWFNYRHSQHVSFIISPFAYFSNFKVIQKASDEPAQKSKEYRFAVAIDLQGELAKHFFITGRTGLEYRLFEAPSNNFVRFRNRIGLRYDAHSKISLQLFDELLLNIAGTDIQHFFDHNRAAFIFSYAPVKPFRMDIGYIYITRLGRTATTTFDEANFVCHLTYILPEVKKK
ncbi:MAG: DUF2490 domain-containing protein [Chitinophagales bacterium]|nr:DUF2490 domain-containing protein [Chitinophagales bacterium]